MSDEDKTLSTAEKILGKRGLADDQKAAMIENFEDYKKALNGVASTPNGQLLLKRWIKALGIFTVTPSRDGVALVGEKALKDFYLTMIRPHLDANLRQEIEN